MNHQFDELTKSLAQSVTRRAALKKFGFGLAGMALACFGLANRAEAAKKEPKCEICIRQCLRKYPTWSEYECRNYCLVACR
ncbi:MAG: hypothetical protein KIS67_04900 [Verrucomicrobiae bacterium]|nr:hypothetical protein [Verrucomicrobiae bacterium]